MATVASLSRPSAPLTPYCPDFQRAVEIIGKRWTGSIIRSLLSGCTRFTEIRQTVDGLSERLLSERLRELEQEGIVHRSVYDEIPVRIEYLLTPKGEDLSPVLVALAGWTDRWITTT